MVTQKLSEPTRPLLGSDRQVILEYVESKRFQFVQGANRDVRDSMPVVIISRCIIIIDGIDDSEPGGASIAQLSRYFRGIKEVCQLQILISAQNLFDLPVGATTLVLDHPSGRSRNDSDIKRYVESKLAPFAEDEELLGNPSLYAQVRDELLDKAHGMSVIAPHSTAYCN